MKLYRLLQRFFVFTFLAYLVIVIYLTGNYQSEIFPIFSWSLYSNARQPIDGDYGIRLLSINGEPITPPTYLRDADSPVTVSSSAALNSTINNFGRAIDQGDVDAMREIKAYFEGIYLSDLEQADYEVVNRVFYVLERWEHGTYTAEVSVGTFTYGEEN